jgi:hypothetical protein
MRSKREGEGAFFNNGRVSPSLSLLFPSSSSIMRRRDEVDERNPQDANATVVPSSPPPPAPARWPMLAHAGPCWPMLAHAGRRVEADPDCRLLRNRRASASSPTTIGPADRVERVETGRNKEGEREKRGREGGFALSTLLHVYTCVPPTLLSFARNPL